ncbi:MAG TPA: WD40 repeat domain-containing protein [Polyangiaceae bacterium]|nr:WD40 repeat domain-containing protein [Polyangiaceae bacterium]
MTTSAAAKKAELPLRWEFDAGDYVAAAELSSDGRFCVIGAGNGCVIGVAADAGRELFRSKAHAGGVLAVAISPDATQFATCGQEPSAKIWRSTGELLCELPGGGAPWVEHVAWAPVGGRVATAAGRRVRLWSAAGAPLVETEPLDSTVSGLAFRRDGTALAAIAYGGVHIWPFVPGAKPRRLEWKGSLISLSWSPNAKVIACGSQDGSVHFWRLSNGRDSEMTGYPFKPKALAWDSESKLLATGGAAAVTVWDFRGKGPEGTQPIQLEAHKGVCTRLAFSPQQGVLASGAQDTSVLLWEPRRGTQPIAYAFLEDEVTALVWHPQQRGLLGGDAAGTLRFWETS